MDDTIDFHTTNTMLDQHSDVRYPLIVGFFFITQPAVAWLLLGLKDRHPRQRETLKPAILPKHASFRQTILGLVRNPFIMHSSCICSAQKPDPPTRIHQQHILDRMVFLLPAVVDFLLIGIFRACYRSFGSIVAKKGGASGSRYSVSSCNRAANSAALRAGSKLWLPKAASKISSNSRTHLLTFG